jgi:hypothetical protein
MTGAVSNPISDWLTVRKSADETVNNSNVLQNDDELSFAVAANTVYYFQAMLRIISTAVADLQVQFTGPAGFSMVWSADPGGVGSYSEASIYQPACGAAEGPLPILHGWIIVGATAGTFQLQWAQKTAEAFNSKVKKGSLLRYLRAT